MTRPDSEDPLALPAANSPAGHTATHRRPARKGLRSAMGSHLGLRWRTRRAVVLVVAAVVLLVITTSVVVLRGLFSGPEDVVREFYAALGARDATHARALLAPDSVVEEDETLLTDATLRNTGYTPPRNVRVKLLPPPADRRWATNDHAEEVQVEYDVAGTPLQWRERLRKSQQILGGWRIVGGLRPLALHNGVRDATYLFAGTPYPSGHRAWVAFPGAYVVTLADHPIFEAAPVTAMAHGGEGPALEPMVRASVRQDVERQVRQYLDACAKSAELNPPRCPFEQHVHQSPVPGQFRAATVTREITRYPTLRLEKGLAMDTPVSVSTETPGQIQVKASYSPSSPPYLDANEYIQVTGRVYANGRDIVFSPTS